MATVACAAVALLALGVPAARSATTAADDGASAWPMYGHDPARTMSTPCPAAPTPAQVRTLLPRWSFHANDVVTATPTVVDGTVYIGAWDGTFDALDLQTGARRWSTVLGPKHADGQADQHTGTYGVITSSASVATVAGRRTVFVGAGDSIYALDPSPDVPDARRVRWRTDLDPTHPTSHGEIESSPVVWDGAPGGPLVIVGSDANQDSGYVGEGVWALRASTGEEVWHFNPEVAAGHPLYGCGNVWSSPALGLDPTAPDDPHRATVYFGTADCPDNSGTACPSDGSDPRCPPGGTYDYSKRWQPYAEAVVAISATDGVPRWSYQGHVPLNRNDDDYGASAQLFSLPGGRQVVGEGGKDGVYVVLDRASGQLIWKQAEQGNGNVKPDLAVGGFIGTTAVLPVAGVPRVFGGSAVDTPVTLDASGRPVPQDPATTARGAQAMRAFSGVDGSTAWWAPQAPTYGATSAANGVVYVGSADGFLRAYDAGTGVLLWAFELGTPVSSGAAITSGMVVIGAGTSEKGAPLANVNGVWAFARG